MGKLSPEGPGGQARGYSVKPKKDNRPVFVVFLFSSFLFCPFFFCFLGMLLLLILLLIGLLVILWEMLTQWILLIILQAIIVNPRRHIPKYLTRDFPRGPMVKNLPCHAGDAGSIPGQGTKIPHAEKQPNLHATAKTQRSQIKNK